MQHQQIFYEPLAYRNLLDFSLQVSAPFSAYPNLVFAPHVYTYAFTVEQDLLGLPAKPGGYPPNFTFGYQTAEAEAQAMRSAVFVTEFGDSSATDTTILANELAAQESTQTGATLWAWKGLSKAPGSCWCTRWQRSSYQTTSNGTPGQGQPQGHAVEGGPADRQPAAAAHARVAHGHGRPPGRLPRTTRRRTPSPWWRRRPRPGGAATGRPTPSCSSPRPCTAWSGSAARRGSMPWWRGPTGAGSVT